MRPLTWVLLMIVCSGCPPELCDKYVRETCHGCNPTVEKMAVTIRIAKLDEALIAELKECGDISVNVAVQDKKQAEAALKGCISTSRKIDEKTRDFLMKQVEGVRVDDAEFNAWNECRISTMQSSKPFVLLMDSHIEGDVYCDSTRAIRGSNADDVASLLKGLPLRVGFEPTNLAWQDQDRVIAEHPELIVIHASAFQEKTASFEGNTKLLNFLDSLKGTRTRVLVYTRGLPGQAAPDVVERWKRLLSKLADPEVKKNAELFVMPKGRASCFQDPEVGVPLTNRIKELVLPERS